MKSPAEDKWDQEIIELLKRLRSYVYHYPPELLAARRAAFLAQVDKLHENRPAGDLASEDKEIIDLLTRLKSTKAVYPPELLAARRAALIGQMESTRSASPREEEHRAPRRIFLSRKSAWMRPALALAGLFVAVLVGSLVLRLRQPSSSPISSTEVAAVTQVSVPNTGGTTVWICLSDEHGSSCTPTELDPSQDLAKPANGSAHPAVSKDARSSREWVHAAAYVNDGREGASWISNSEDSWIKIDLGKVTTINTVSFQKGGTDPSMEGDLGQFVISVALSDVYADGDSTNDYQEYTPVFRSEPTILSQLAQAETIQAQFPMVRARFVKLTFEKAGAAIEEVGVFMVEPEVTGAEPTSSPVTALPGITLTIRATTLMPVETVTSATTATSEPTLTAVSSSTSTLVPTDPPLPTSTTMPEPTVPLPTQIVPSDTPLPSPTTQPSPVTNDPIIVTGADQTLVFTCNGNAAEIRGHANTITLLGSCNSITVTGNGNRVFWQYGSPVIINRGNNNIIEQL